MKYILKMLLLCVALIPFMIWEVLVTIWTFDKSGVSSLWRDFTETLSYNHRKAFGKRRKHKPSTF